MQEKGFLERLFDFSFSQFITLQIIPVLYVLALILCGISTLIFAFSGFAKGFLAGILSLILAPIVFLLLVIGARIYAEVIIVFFRIAENTRRMVENQNTRPTTGQQ